MRSRRDGTESWQLLDEFKELPQIKPLVAGGTVAEYSAHAIAEGGISQVPRLCRRRLPAGRRHRRPQPQRPRHRARHGLRHRLGLLRRRGGHEAAKAAGDFSAAGLAGYEASLRDSFVLKDLETARAIPSFIENPRLFTHYPKAVSRLLESVYTDRRPVRRPASFKKAWSGRASATSSTWRRVKDAVVDAEDLRGEEPCR